MGSNHMHDLFRDSKRLSNRFLEKGETKILKGNQFRKGISIPLTYHFDSKFLEDTRQSSASLQFILSSELYYGKYSFKERGESLSYHGQEKHWNKNIAEGKAKVFFNVRDAIRPDETFDFNQINDGFGNFGKDCIINLTAVYRTN